ncbi:helicase-like transcription factor CHR28 [Bidens hawaiensis]|uniref:helicase-like transcription factor CHR28 n=1 Tax=Bidens hawaiensis TaxID=980011 RepID=UPI00404A2AB6
MMMANVGTSYGWQFDGDDDDDGLMADDGALSMDMDSFMSILEERQPDDSQQSGLVDPSLSTAPFNESASDVGPNEHSPTLYDHAEGSASRTVYSSGSSDCGKQTINHGVTKVEPQPDVSSAHVNSWTPGDWSIPILPGNFSPSGHYDSKKDFRSASHYDVREPKFERATTSATFDGNFDLNMMDNSGITDEMYSDVMYNMNDKSSMPYGMDINGPSYSGPPSMLYDDGTLFEDKFASASNTFLPSSESSTETHAKLSNNGTHYPSMLPSKREIISIMVGTSDMGTERSYDVADLFTDNKPLPPFYGAQNSRDFVKIRNSSVMPPQSYIFPGIDLMPPKVGPQAYVKNTTYIDVDDPDICILEDLSVPAPRKQSPVEGKSPITVPVRPPLVVPPVHTGYNNNVRAKANDEHIIYRAALQDLSQPKSEAYAPEGSLEVQLLRHQRIALSWMVQKETKSLHCFGGILADDQGLGKTISTISLILKERSPSSSVNTAEMKNIKTETLNLDDDDEDDVTGGNQSKQSDSSVMESNAQSRPAAGTLVVCPTSVLRQWNDELHNKVTNKARLSVLVYHGPNRTKDPCELAKYDVVLTTYAIVSMEVPKQPLVDEDEDETKRRNELHPCGPSSGNKRKHSSSKSSKKSKKGIDCELYESLARPLAKVRWFRVVLDEAQSIKNHRTQVARACWGLKAKRRWCLSGTPIQNAIDDLYSYFRFLKYDPYAVYKTFCSTIKSPIQRNPATGYKKLQAVLKTIMLRRTKATLLDGEPVISLPPKTINLKKVEFTPEERDFYHRLESDSRAQFEEYAAAGTVKQNYVNILLMLLRLRQACDHPLLVKGCKSSSEWTSSLDKAKQLPHEKRISLLNCLEASLCSLCSDPPEDAVVTPCEHVFCNQCILEHLSTDDSQCPFSKCKAVLNTASIYSKLTLKSSIVDEITEFSGIVKAEINDPNSSSWSSNVVASEALDSSKIKAAVEVLESIVKPCEIETDDNSNKVKVVREKAIVFSQWTRMLDLLEACLNKSSIDYRRLDGTMSIAARDKAVKDFNTLPEVTVMIMSLKAASLGLNMVAACHVLLLDLWWNPTTEDQAVDRAHRIGQTRPVSVLRLTVKDTVEDRILALQQKKREMVASAFGEDETGGGQTRLTVDDLKYLFQA